MCLRAPVICLLLGISCTVPGAEITPTVSAGQVGETATRIVMLGTGTPGAEPNRSGPATAIVVGDSTYIIDFGPGVVRQASRAWRLHGLRALTPPNLRIAFLTHLHSDHTAGYPDLILTPWVLGRREALNVYGPPGTSAMTSALLEAYREDIRVRVEGPERLSAGRGIAHGHDVEPGLVYEDNLIKVEAFRVPHGTWKHAYGYRFTSADRTIVISGDTAPFDGFVDIAKDADVLIHEAYGRDGFDRLAPSSQRYHGTFHTSTTRVGELASAAGVGMVILYHQLHFGGETPEQLVREVQSAFDGLVVYGRDLEMY